MLQDSKDAEVVQLSACYLSRLSSDQNAGSRSNEGAGGKIDEVVCRGARLVSSNPYQEARFFQLQLFSLASSRPGFQPPGRPLSHLINFNQTYPRPTTLS